MAPRPGLRSHRFNPPVRSRQDFYTYFSRLGRGEAGHHHQIAGPYLPRYAQEAAWRDDLRRVGNGEQVHGVIGLAMRCKPSIDFSGYWQRAHVA